MSKSKESAGAPGLQAFIQAHDQLVCDFCAHLLPGEVELEELVVSVFREFGEQRRKSAAAAEVDPGVLRVELFQIAWQRIQEQIHEAIFPALGSGRDTRALVGMDEDLLNAGTGSPLGGAESLRAAGRLARVDAELRAPVVLRDILGFTDEQSARVLGLRWGVYRHRLHRGRLDFKDSLRGMPTGLPIGKGAQADG